MMYKDSTTVAQEAKAFLQQLHEEGQLADWRLRWREVSAEIAATGSWIQTSAELAYGARLAWRNSNRCIGRLFWETLRVLDARHVQNEADFLEALGRHLQEAEAAGKIRNLITVFAPAHAGQSPPRFTLRNYTLIMYAGYVQGNKIIGDPANVDFTAYCQSLGWRGAGTSFDVLPVVYSVQGGPDRFYELPPELVTEIPIHHPEHSWVADQGWRWYKLPVIANMPLDLGGVVYPTAPFNGWYMLDEIATRNLGDRQRYNLLPAVAEQLSLDLRSPFWRERALLLLNEAVYHSFRTAGATIVDHHTAVAQFMKFRKNELARGREVTGDWSWLIPPTASSTTEVFHLPLNNTHKLPNYLPGPARGCPFHQKKQTESNISPVQ